MGLGLYGGAAYNQGYRNRYNTGGSATESLGFKEANLYLQDQYQSMGLNVSVQSDYKNVIAELKGTETPDRVIIVCGHYDHPQFNGDAPGGDDNASGTAGVLEAARILSQYQFKSTIRFISWGGEEGWMLGSWDYVNNVVKANNENIAGVLNLDMILRPGFDNDLGHVKDLNVSTGTAANCQEWGNGFLAAGHKYAPNLTFYSGGLQTQDWYPSDQGPFIQEGYAGLMIAENTATEIWGGSHAYYHTWNDASDRLANDPNNPTGVTYDYLFATDVVRATVGYTAEQAGMVPEPATMATLAIGFIALAMRRRKRS
jgi:Zn-dependent M28 family amino/carboxypeptidase